MSSASSDALSSVSTKPQTLSQPIIDIEDLFSDRVYLDDSRRKFLKKNTDIIDSLVTGHLDNRNRYRQLLLAPKRSGKTTLLEIIEAYGKSVASERESMSNSGDLSVGRRLNVHRFSCADIEHTPFQIILNDLYPGNIEKTRNNDNPITTTRRSDGLEERMVAQNKFSLLLFDDFESIYHRGDFGKQFLSEIIYLLNTNRGRVHMVLAGDSTHLGRLAYGKLPRDQHHLYSAYFQSNLNHTKLNPNRIFNFCGVHEFRELVDVVKRNVVQNAIVQTENGISEIPKRYQEPDKNIAELFVFSGGNPGKLYDLLAECDDEDDDGITRIGYQDELAIEHIVVLHTIAHVPSPNDDILRLNSREESRRKIMEVLLPGLSNDLPMNKISMSDCVPKIDPLVSLVSMIKSIDEDDLERRVCCGENGPDWAGLYTSDSNDIHQISHQRLRCILFDLLDWGFISYRTSDDMMATRRYAISGVDVLM